MLFHHEARRCISWHCCRHGRRNSAPRQLSLLQFPRNAPCAIHDWNSIRHLVGRCLQIFCNVWPKHLKHMPLAAERGRSMVMQKLAFRLHFEARNGQGHISPSDMTSVSRKAYSLQPQSRCCNCLPQLATCKTSNPARIPHLETAISPSLRRISYMCSVRFHLNNSLLLLPAS